MNSGCNLTSSASCDWGVNSSRWDDGACDLGVAGMISGEDSGVGDRTVSDLGGEKCLHFFHLMQKMVEFFINFTSTRS